MRLIDADEIIEFLDRMQEAAEDGDEKAQTFTADDVIDILTDAPTVEIYKNIGLRPCLVDGKKAYFHKWCGRSKIIEASPLIGGNSGLVQWTVAIVEYEDGTIAQVLPCDIRFTDREAQE